MPFQGQNILCTLLKKKKKWPWIVILIDICWYLLLFPLKYFLSTKAQVMFWSWEGIGFIRPIHVNFCLFWVWFGHLKRARIFTFQPNKPLLRSNNHLFHKKLKSPHSVTYNTCPQALLVCISPKSLLIWLKRLSQNFYWMSFKKTWCKGGGGSCPLITLTLIKGTEASDYQSNEPPPKFIWPNFQ